MSLEMRTKVITMRHAGLGVQQILEEEGASVSRMAIYSLCDKYQSTMSVVDLKRRAKPQLLEDCHYRFIDDTIADNVDMTSRQLLDFRVSRARVHFHQNCQASTSSSRMGVKENQVLCPHQQEIPRKVAGILQRPY